MLLALVLAASLTPGDRVLLQEERHLLDLTEPSLEPAATFLIVGAGAGLGAVGSAIGFAVMAASGPEDDDGLRAALATGMVLGAVIAITCIVLGIIEWSDVSHTRSSHDARRSEIDRELGAL